MSKHLTYAVVENRGRYEIVEGRWEARPNRVCYYLKRFNCRDDFDKWVEMVADHVTVIKRWTDRPPCHELQAIKEQYKDQWVPNP